MNSSMEKPPQSPKLQLTTNKPAITTYCLSVQMCLLTVWWPTSLMLPQGEGICWFPCLVPEAGWCMNIWAGTRSRYFWVCAVIFVLFRFSCSSR